MISLRNKGGTLHSFIYVTHLRGLCNDPLKTCTVHTIGEINHEYDDGRRY